MLPQCCLIKAFQYLLGIPAQRVHQLVGGFVSVPSAGSMAHHYRCGGRGRKTESIIVQVIPKKHFKQVFCCGSDPDHAA